MKLLKRKHRQECLAKIFYEMGMDIELVSKISGVNVSKITTFELKQKKTSDIDKKMPDNI